MLREKRRHGTDGQTDGQVAGRGATLREGRIMLYVASVIANRTININIWAPFLPKTHDDINVTFEDFGRKSLSN